jgi:hypothetical protein
MDTSAAHTSVEKRYSIFPHSHPDNGQRVGHVARESPPTTNFISTKLKVNQEHRYALSAAWEIIILIGGSQVPMPSHD